ncbi:transposase [Streptomyces sp. NBC_00467]
MHLVALREFFAANAEWLTVVQLPLHAPDLNVQEASGRWSSATSATWFPPMSCGPGAVNPVDRYRRSAFMVRATAAKVVGGISFAAAGIVRYSPAWIFGWVSVTLSCRSWVPPFSWRA